MLTFSTKSVPLGEIITGRNVRLPSLMKIEELYEDIHENGLITPLTVFMKGKQALVIAGHRRHAACTMLFAKEPKIYAKHFPNGIPCTVTSGITEAEAEAMKVDHGNEVGLSDPMELQLCVNILLYMGLTEKACVIRLAALMDRIKPMKADKAKKYRQMLADAELRKEQGNLLEYNAKIQEAYTFLLNYRRGMMQNHAAAFECPDVVMAALYFKSTGERPPQESGFAVDKNEVIPDGLTYDHVKKLRTAFGKDLDTRVDGACPYNKRVPGPEFLSKWEEIKAEIMQKAIDSASKTTRDKAMSAGEMDEEIKKAKWASKGFQLLTRYHRNEKDIDMTVLKGLDLIANIAELLSTRAPDEWVNCVKLGEAIEKEMIAATQNDTKPPIQKPAKVVGGKGK